MAAPPDRRRRARARRARRAGTRRAAGTALPGGPAARPRHPLGADATLDAWRARFAPWPPAAFRAETTSGARRRIEVQVDAAFADAILDGGSHERVDEPARTVVAV